MRRVKAYGPDGWDARATPLSEGFAFRHCWFSVKRELLFPVTGYTAVFGKPVWKRASIYGGEWTKASAEAAGGFEKEIRARIAAPASMWRRRKKGRKSCQRSQAWPTGALRHSEEITEKACSRALGAVCL